MFALPPSAKAFVDAGGCSVVTSLLSSLQVALAALVSTAVLFRFCHSLQPACCVAAASIAASLLKQPTSRSLSTSKFKTSNP
jgi:hypothetical protein